MCIYLENRKDLTYLKQEHVIPAALGCHTKLDIGVVSDQANEYFSPIERRVIERSMIQLPRIIEGPGKRGKLSPKHATVSEVSVVKHGGFDCLGYMRGTEGYILSQFVIDSNNKIKFLPGTCDETNIDMQSLKDQIASMGEKYVPIYIKDAGNCVFITFFKEKLHIGYGNELSEQRRLEIKRLFEYSFGVEKSTEVNDRITLTLDIEHDFVSVGKVVAKTAINTLAYIMGADFIENSKEFDEIINMIFSHDDAILKRLYGIENTVHVKEILHLSKEQQACLISKKGIILKAKVFFYEEGYEIILCDNFTKAIPFIIEGIVCDWKNTKKDYKYIEYLTKIGILT